MSTELRFEKFAAKEVTNDMLKEAADLFSSCYGIWGPLATEKMGSFFKQGNRVKMSAARIKDQSLVEGSDSFHVRALIETELIGHVFATRWLYQDKQICWVTQLCVKPKYRRKGLATKLFAKLRENEKDWAFGILSSHPAAIRAASRAFGSGIQKVDFDVIKEHGREILKSSPVNYVKQAEPRGSVFREGEEDGVVCCAFTDFWVDHREPLDCLQFMKEEGIKWPFGELPEGTEYLMTVKGV